MLACFLWLRPFYQHNVGGRGHHVVQCAKVASAVLFFQDNGFLLARMARQSNPCSSRRLSKMSGTDGHGEALHDLAAEGTSR